MVEETKKNRKEFDAKEREFLEHGYAKCGEINNRSRFRKYIPGGEESIVILIKGWIGAENSTPTP